MKRRSQSRTLARDQDGAVMLIGLFMAVFLVALLYYVVGIGEAIEQRERMQDGADAAAFSAASLLARGMNTLALANMVMAALLAILVALKLVEALTAIAIALIAIFAFFTPGLAGFIPGLSKLRADVRAVHDELEPTIHAALRTLHTIEHGVRVLAPAAAQLRAIEIVRVHYRPPAAFGFLLPSSQMTLATEDGAFSEVCDHATGYVASLVSLTLTPVVPGDIAGLLGEATSDLVAADSTWFCGDGSAKPPRTTLRFERNLPLLASRRACGDQRAEDRDYDAEQHAELCARAEAEEQASEPDHDTGACAHDCGRGGPYAQRTALAREQCQPDDAHELTGFAWVQRNVERRYTFHRGQWRIARDEVVGHGRRVVGDYPPCGDDRRAIGTRWETQGRTADAEPVPLCSDEKLPQERGFEGASFGPVVITEVVDLLGCIEHVKLTRKVAPDAGTRAAETQAETRSEAPQRIAKDAHLGDEMFQARALVIGAPPGRSAKDLVRLARWGRAAPSPESAFAESARLAAHSAFAQAEYYYAVHDPAADERASYLWNMRWKARFRRFRLPEHASDAAPIDLSSASASDRDDAAQFGAAPAPTDARAACSDARVQSMRNGSSQAQRRCESIADTLSNADELIIH